MNINHLRVQNKSGQVGPICGPYSGGTTTPDMAKVNCHACLNKFERAKKAGAISHD